VKHLRSIQIKTSAVIGAVKGGLVRNNIQAEGARFCERLMRTILEFAFAPVDFHEGDHNV
jgi:hypothetical protein